jgi:uncharacterized protein (DUF2344 family)
VAVKEFLNAATRWQEKARDKIFFEKKKLLERHTQSGESCQVNRRKVDYT